jgi:GDP-L-fucose synthase
VLPGLLRKFHEAQTSGAEYVNVWGSGRPRREFLHVDDMASACLYIMNLDKETYEANTKPMLSHVNIGTGKDCTIRELAETIAKVTGFKGKIRFDPTKPDGTPQKLLDVSRLNALGWKATISLEDGIRQTYQWFLEHQYAIRVK